MLKLEVANFLLRALVDPILLTYHIQTRALLMYEGLSNIKDPEGKSFNVRITLTTVKPN